MTNESKQLLRELAAKSAIENWRTCPIYELEAAAKIYESAIFLLIRRQAKPVGAYPSALNRAGWGGLC